nr:MAG TPA: hypothetical protein [Caudoviricetes sp.]
MRRERTGAKENVRRRSKTAHVANMTVKTGK